MNALLCSETNSEDVVCNFGHLFRHLFIIGPVAPPLIKSLPFNTTLPEGNTYEYKLFCTYIFWTQTVYLNP